MSIQRGYCSRSAVRRLLLCAVGAWGVTLAAGDALAAEPMVRLGQVSRGVGKNRPDPVIQRTAWARQTTQPDARFKNLGRPVVHRTLAMSIVTRDQHGNHVAWASLESADKLGLLGVRVDTGAILWRDLSEYGRAHIRMRLAGDGHIYLYCGRPGRFLRLDADTYKLTDLGVPDQKASYWLGHAIGPDGRFYVGAYPRANLVFLDPSTGTVGDLGRLPNDDRQAYVLHPVVSDNNVAYCPVGLHHMELWTLDLNTGDKRQILPESLTQLRGCPKVWIGDDGNVYGRAGTAQFRCHPGRVELGQTAPRRAAAARNQAGQLTASHIDAQGRLVLVDTASGRKRFVPTDFRGVGVSIFSIGCQRDGWIYGGTFSPATLFRCHHKTDRLEDLGRVTAGRTQIYDAINGEDGVYLTSYGGGCIDRYNPDASPDARQKISRIVRLSSRYEQERPIQIVKAGDGMLYTGTVPIKGVLGGALVRIDPHSGRVNVWRNIIPEQSVRYLTPIAEQQLFCASSVRGGTSAIPSRQEAYVFIWDAVREAIVHKAQPVPGTRHYGSVATSRSGIVYGIAGDSYYAFDPGKRQTVARQQLPVRRIAFPGLCGNPLGKEGEIIGLGDDAVFAISPVDHTCRIVVRHPSIRAARGVFLTRDGTLYYGSGDDLWRCRLSNAPALPDS